MRTPYAVLALLAVGCALVGGSTAGRLAPDPSTTSTAQRVQISPARAAPIAMIVPSVEHEPPESGASAVPAPRPATASFALLVGRQRVPLRVMALAVLPGAEVEIRQEDARGGTVRATARGGRLRRAAVGRWVWSAPRAPGFHTVRFVSSEPVDSIRVTFMVARPATEIREGRLNGYRIGTYRARPASMSAAYEPPAGFVEVRPEHHDLPVSPNFRLGQFLCKEPGDPRYVLVSPRLLIKLEALLAEVNVAGYPTASLTVMSGFRTPAYNRAIGNNTDFSRHLWGDAADVYVDVDGDGQMDDLNGDGRRDVGDARWLAGVVERMMDRRAPTSAPGGLSVYRRNAAHGPFVHMDARGYPARW